jgi:DNA-binding NtrC family response regulator
VRKSAAKTGPVATFPAEPPRREASKTLEQQEYEAVAAALQQTGGNRTHAAQLLGITRRGLIYKLKRLGLG